MGLFSDAGSTPAASTKKRKRPENPGVFVFRALDQWTKDFCISRAVEHWALDTCASDYPVLARPLLRHHYVAQSLLHPYADL